MFSVPIGVGAAVGANVLSVSDRVSRQHASASSFEWNANTPSHTSMQSLLWKAKKINQGFLCY